MTKSYSNDLRKRVVEYLDGGNCYREASQLFKGSISAIGRWYRRYKEVGNYQGKIKGGLKKKIDLNGFAAKKFNVSSFTISYWLRKLGYSYKKRVSAT